MRFNHLKQWQLLVTAFISGSVFGCGVHRSLAVPDVVPLGQISRAHWHTMEANGEAADFVLYRNEFVNGGPEFSPYGRDHMMEIAARMSSTPFPVIVQRSEHNSNPELDEVRRMHVVRTLTDLGAFDAEQRVVVSQPYSDGIHSVEAEQDYATFRLSRGH